MYTLLPAETLTSAVQMAMTMVAILTALLSWITRPA